MKTDGLIEAVERRLARDGLDAGIAAIVRAAFEGERTLSDRRLVHGRRCPYQTRQVYPRPYRLDGG